MKSMQEKPFSKGERVPEDGEYVCVPCGYHNVYQAGDQFKECVSCLSGTPEGKEEFAEGLEMWEKIRADQPRTPPAHDSKTQ